MPVVRVRYLASFQICCRKASERVPIGRGESLEDLRRRLIVKYGADFEKCLSGERCVVFINGKEASGNSRLQDNDEVTFAIALGGG